MIHNKKIAFYGAGAMAEAIISGIVKSELIPSTNILAINRSNKDRLTYLEEIYHIQTSQNLQDLQSATIIFLAMKPKDVHKALLPLQQFLHNDALIISVAAGISCAQIEQACQKQVAVIRSMPNTSATLGLSATGIARGMYASDTHVQTAKTLLQTIGIVEEVEEDQLHVITGLSGSGPAYFYYVVEAMEVAAIQLGLPENLAHDFAVQTILGSASMLKETQKPAPLLRKEVTSPNGTTEAGIRTLDEYHVKEAIQQCVKNATKRSIELGK
ncbi:pyrroline-5-carboxylate reductase [Massilibacterium senegalense]|uniref:pyrroline-5-carboxylate reductase n=1 Tax=Massilibacterium senegalense TaxID=1632858 RepID=UPI000782DA58|nr:pyrroline-5-carboxylate reductase [Massilibacterium senegalense]